MEEKSKNELYQSHGDHIDCIMETGTFMKQHLQQVVGQSIIWQKSKTRFSSDTMNNELTDVFSLRYGTADIALQTMLAYNPKEAINELASIYPVMNGRSCQVKIERVIEWVNHIEATIICSIGEFDFAFFAIDYYLNKSYYVEGQELEIELSALGMNVKPGQRGFDFTGQQAIDFKAKTGEKPEYDENGEVIPIHFDLTQLVAYLNTDEKAPDEAEFQSPVNNISDSSILGVDFHKVDITVCRRDTDEGELSVSVPLYFRKDFIETISEDDPICGWLWMTGAVYGKHGKLNDHTEEHKTLGEMCRDFEDFMKKCNFRCFDNLTPVARQLNLLEIKKGYELDAFQIGNDHGSRFQIYCCKEKSTDRYEPTQKKIVPKQGVEMNLLGFIQTKITREVKKDVHVPYNDSQYIEGLLSWEEAQDVPSPLSYFKVPFTREGIMQAWLLNCIPDFMPMTWHACYNSKEYIYSKESVDKIFQDSDRRMKAKEQVLEIDIDELLPDVVVQGDNATLRMSYWSDWGGLVLLTVDVKRDGSSVCFSEPKREILVEYHCGIRF